MKHTRTETRYLALLASWIAFAGASWAQTTWYVDASAVPPGNGTLASPYTGIQHAIEQPTTVHDDVLSVAPGTYWDNLLITKRVKIVSQGGPDVTVLRPLAPAAAVESVVSETGFPYSVASLRGFTLDGTGNPSGTGIRVTNGHVLGLERCVVREFTTGRGLYQSGVSFIDVFQTTIARNSVGIYIQNAIHYGGVTLGGCILRGNTQDYFDPTSVSVVAWSSCVPPSLVGLNSQNFSTGPGYWNQAGGDLHLAPLSP